MARGSVTGGETFARDKERGGIGTGVEEVLGDHVQGQERLGGEVVVGEANDGEDDGEEDKTDDLEGPSAKGIDDEDGGPVAR